MYKKFLKRVIDICLSLGGIMVLWFPMLVIAVAIKLDSNGPVFFKQKRVGIHKTHFNILKFRTMRTDTPHDAPTHELSDPKKWITKVGAFLRKTSLDELPQLFNILVGDMSVIGPRPALWNQYDLIEERDKYGANDIYKFKWVKGDKVSISNATMGDSTPGVVKKSYLVAIANVEEKEIE